jgi:hypothetical protein
MGYTQDRYASAYLEEQSPALYEEYAAQDSNSFLLFSEVRGLDGSKVGSVVAKSMDDSQTLTADEQIVKDSSFHGGQMALKTTAAIPAVLAVGFLMLLLYFKSQGGYKAIELTEVDSEEPGD